MISIAKAKVEDANLLAELGSKTFIESHGQSASKADIDKYMNEKFNSNVVLEELSDRKNIYHIIYRDQQPAGYSKIIFNENHSGIQNGNVTKLERLYLLKEFYDLKLGHQLLEFNISLSEQNNQDGMWLFVWKENLRAVRFYEKAGFEVVGSYDFKLTDTHSNPNHQMLLTY
ncbi:MAG: GNAT family N-acetyltransferase [Bacteroidetes bacterium]|nr:GNAT family N-acetyltransferase [Bacteroidota bacterium]